MRVTLIHRDLHQITRGGICTLYLALADELIRCGHEVVLVTQDTPHPVVRPGRGSQPHHRFRDGSQPPRNRADLINLAPGHARTPSAVDSPPSPDRSP